VHVGGLRTSRERKSDPRGFLERAVRSLIAAVISLVAVGGVIALALTLSKSDTPHATASPIYKFLAPYDVVISGGDVFVTNSGGNSVTEFKVSTRKLVRVFRGKAYHFDGPSDIAITGEDAFVTNDPIVNRVLRCSITEFNTSTGVVVRVLDAASYDFQELGGIAISGHDAFVTHGGPDGVTEFNTPLAPSFGYSMQGHMDSSMRLRSRSQALMRS